MTNVVFDVGQVLIRWNPMLVYRDHFASDAEIEAFLQEIEFGPWNLAQDRGRTWDEGVSLKSAEHPEHAELIARFHTHWHDAVPGHIEDSVRALTDLHDRGQPLFAITNFSAEKWAECQVRFPFLTLFRDVVVSAHEKLVKPDPAIFRLFLDRNGLEAEDCLFIDDSPANIASASSLGFDTILFDEPRCLLGRLRTRGLPV